MGAKRERGHPVLHVGVSSLSSPSSDSGPGESTDGADTGQWPRNNGLSHTVGSGGACGENEVMYVSANTEKF